MPPIAEDSNNAPKLLLVDANGKLVLGAGTDKIGNVNEARGKTILYDRDRATDETLVLREVTGGTTYYLLAAGLSIHSTTDNKGGWLYNDSVVNPILVLQSSITATYKVSDSQATGAQFPHPIPIAAGREIKLYSNDAGVLAEGWIVGWEE